MGPSKRTIERLLEWLRANHRADRPQDAAWHRDRADFLEQLASDEPDEAYRQRLEREAVDARATATRLERRLEANRRT